MARAWTFPALLLVCALGESSAIPPLVFSWGHHSASALPVYGAFSFPLHSAVRAGTEWGYGKNRCWEDIPWAWLQGFDLAAFRNPYHGTGVMATTQGIVRRNTRWGVFLDLSLEAGYLHVFRPRETFTAKGDGTFRRSSDRGRPSALLGPGLHLGYRTFRLGPAFLHPRLEYSYRIQYPYNDLIPIFPHNILQLGFTLGLGKGADGGKRD